METFRSDLSGNEFPIHEKISGNSIRRNLFDYIAKKHPEFKVSNSLSITELNLFREEYITGFLSKEKSQLTKLEKTVLASMTDKSVLTDILNENDKNSQSTGQRIADKVASFGGSWTFIISFGIFLGLWITSNVILLANKGFDPYPFILLNLILSCIAAMQAPVIMMSQNRQEEKDRERAKKDYMINLKSELEIRSLHEKIDHLMMHQQQELVEIQKVQIEMMNDIIARVENLK
ncbi:MAG: hypothetical protein CVU11_13320 [Bacteroidetes bacterium HGW-Bacteroidetes-6]|jgi:uncharacterized membrane protein|nr:MAG: hypothetical protein CVU11_13320 [Bacteroidetes bacterium HGW-Bacteroidetes-6]